MNEDNLADVLRSNGVDATSLVPLFKTLQPPSYRLSATGSDAVRLWLQLRGLVEATGHWPLILGGDEDLEGYEEMLDYVVWPPAADEMPAVERLLQEAVQLDTDVWLRERVAAEPEYYDLDDLLTGNWPDQASPQRGFNVPAQVVSGGPLPVVYVALVPTTVGWQVPAYLGWGGWNECPEPDEHAAMMKRWGERYGAEVVCMSRDVVGMRVAQPPMDREAALALAREQFIYCADIVIQGTNTLENLAATLIGAEVWYFWWD